MESGFLIERLEGSPATVHKNYGRPFYNEEGEDCSPGITAGNQTFDKKYIGIRRECKYADRGNRPRLILPRSRSLLNDSVKDSTQTPIIMQTRIVPFSFNDGRQWPFV